jgi:signal transduction histidine kinase
VWVRHYGGLGLGLWAVRSIAEAHGWTVRARSEPGSGATFEVELPSAAW